MMMRSIMDFTWFPESIVVTQRRSRTIGFKARFRDMFAQCGKKTGQRACVSEKFHNTQERET